MTMVKLISFPPASGDGYDNLKIPGIKAARAAFGLSLRDAKYLIEDLQSQSRQVTMNCKDDSALDDFVRLGGKIAHVSEIIIERLIECAADAISGKQYDLATDIIALVKKHNG